MERRDYLLRQLQEFMQALLNITGLIQEGKVHDGIKAADDFFSSNLDLSLSDLEEKTPDEILDFLINEKKLDTDQVEVITKILFQQSLLFEGSGNEKRAMQNFLICKRLFTFVDETSDTFSFERMDLLQQLAKKTNT